MELKGKIVKVLSQVTGVTGVGKSWKKRDYVIEIGSGTQYPKKVAFTVFGEDRLQNFNIKEGEELTVYIDIDAHEFKGSWYNSITAYKIQRPENNYQAAHQQLYQGPLSTGQDDEPPF